MRIGGGFEQIKCFFSNLSDSIRDAAQNLFQNIKNALGKKEVFNAMESPPTASTSKPLEQKNASLAGSSVFGNKPADTSSSPSEAWFEAHNQELKTLKEQFHPSMKDFLAVRYLPLHKRTILRT
jgi:hypothetical protein